MGLFYSSQCYDNYRGAILSRQVSVKHSYARNKLIWDVSSSTDLRIVELRAKFLGDINISSLIISQR